MINTKQNETRNGQASSYAASNNISNNDKNGLNDATGRKLSGLPTGTTTNQVGPPTPPPTTLPPPTPSPPSPTPPPTPSPPSPTPPPPTPAPTPPPPTQPEIANAAVAQSVTDTFCLAAFDVTPSAYSALSESDKANLQAKCAQLLHNLASSPCQIGDTETYLQCFAMQESMLAMRDSLVLEALPLSRTPGTLVFRRGDGLVFSSPAKSSQKASLTVVSSSSAGVPSASALPESTNLCPSQYLCSHPTSGGNTGSSCANNADTCSDIIGTASTIAAIAALIPGLQAAGGISTGLSLLEIGACRYLWGELYCASETERCSATCDLSPCPRSSSSSSSSMASSSLAALQAAVALGGVPPPQTSNLRLSAVMSKQCPNPGLSGNASATAPANNCRKASGGFGNSTSASGSFLSQAAANTTKPWANIAGLNEQILSICRSVTPGNTDAETVVNCAVVMNDRALSVCSDLAPGANSYDGTCAGIRTYSAFVRDLILRSDLPASVGYLWIDLDSGFTVAGSPPLPPPVRKRRSRELLQAPGEVAGTGCVDPSGCDAAAAGTCARNAQTIGELGTFYGDLSLVLGEPLLAVASSRFGRIFNALGATVATLTNPYVLEASCSNLATRCNTPCPVRNGQGTTEPCPTDVCCCPSETGTRCGTLCCCCPYLEAPRGPDCACVAAFD